MMAFPIAALDQAPKSLKSKLKDKSRARRDALVTEREAQSFRTTRRNDISPLLAIAETPIARLRPPARETRKSAAAHVREVAHSISTLGFCVPVLIGQGDIVLDGWIRVEAAKALGLDRVPCVRIDHLTEVEQRLLRIAVNRLGEKGEWDLEALKLEFEELILEEAPIEIAGFTLDEIDHISSARRMRPSSRDRSRLSLKLWVWPESATSLFSVLTGSPVAARPTRRS
jgi:ParB-like nuclease domain